MDKEHFKTEDGKIVSLDLERFVSAEIERPSSYFSFFESTPVVILRREVDNNYGGGSRINIYTKYPENLTDDIYEALQRQREEEADGPHRTKKKSGVEEET